MYDSLGRLFGQQPDRLTEWNHLCHAWVYHQLGIPEQPLYGVAVETSGEAENPLNLIDVILPKTEYNDLLLNMPVYPQVFEDRIGFQANMSVLDILLCLGGKAALGYLLDLKPIQPIRGSHT